MKHILIAAALALVGCTPTVIPPAPVAVANQTVLDEQAAISTELAYKAARTALELAVDTNLLKGERAALAASLDQRAFASVTAVRAAYKAGNASSYVAAARGAHSIIRDMLAIIR